MKPRAATRARAFGRKGLPLLSARSTPRSSARSDSDSLTGASSSDYSFDPPDAHHGNRHLSAPDYQAMERPRLQGITQQIQAG